MDRTVNAGLRLAHPVPIVEVPLVPLGHEAYEKRRARSLPVYETKPIPFPLSKVSHFVE
jgi:hypothetical protein